MALDYRPARQDIALGNGQTVSVRGLNLNDAAMLMAAHANTLAGLYSSFEKMSEQGADQIAAAAIIRMTVELPDVAADIIAVAADEPDHASAAKALPLTAQIAALQAIAALTFEAGGGLGNFLAALKGISAGLGLQTPAMSLPQDSRPAK